MIVTPYEVLAGLRLHPRQEIFWADATYELALVQASCELGSHIRRGTSPHWTEYYGVLRSNWAGWHSLLDSTPDKKKATLRKVARDKRFDEEAVRIISRAAQERDYLFFKRLADALESKNPPRNTAWRWYEANIDHLLLRLWCNLDVTPTGNKIFPQCPPLCFFVGKARAEFCAALLGKPNDENFRDAVRQRVKRLGLKRPKQPKIKDVSIQDSTMRFS